MLHSLIGVLSLLIHMGIPVAMIHMQGDDGTVLIFIFMFLIMSFVGGVQLRYFLIMLLLLAAGIPILWNYFLNEEHKSRFTAIFDIDGNAMTNYGWQQYQGKVSVASGGLSGSGLGNGARVASGIVPEQENDFIFTVAGRRARLYRMFGAVVHPACNLREAGHGRDRGKGLSRQNDLYRRILHDRRTDSYKCGNGIGTAARHRYHLALLLFGRYLSAVCSDRHRVGTKRILSQRRFGSAAG